MRILNRRPTTPDALIVPLKLIALEAAKGSDLTSGQPISACVTNPFMVTGAFTIFLGLEPFFIRILAVAGAARPDAAEILTFVRRTIYSLALHNRAQARAH
jgi:hypothetical protein